ncbi:inorganic phosphate transporter [Desulfovibrio legallii]|jgi:PiT family inorganic phosphate transporter|uniref:Inorganic phosphate transporter n=2 Tax=Desulfovibrio TaxID=872 RepID=A0A6H3F9F3_9BACT|nr:inorganic phosphate transporter [Desulfovibrio legallii]RHH19202.1 anion permease [Desulfovibrio sp. AM18-2]TBH78591.1 inorganic phosphate transporter [Desulfovibrio legallii]CAI3240787.1 Probable low-affinity inorganic phosphate transporter [Desulfovibrio diazotrophicus]
MFDVPVLLALIVLVALLFDFTNGAHDCANAIATVVSTKVVTPRFAVGAAALLNLGGALLGTEVAKTLGSGIVLPEVVEGSHVLVLAALVGAISWNCITWYFGIPSSSSHALIGGLIGAAVADVGFDALNIQGIVDKVLIPLVGSPLAGFAVGFASMWIIYWICGHIHRRKVNAAFRRLQLLSAAFMATSHGLNDAQKTMGIIALALYIFGKSDSLEVPLWVKLGCAGAMALGTAVGGWKIVRTMGHRIFKLEPVHGFAAESSAAMVITGASLLGAPVSTTHTITACIFGVGSTKRLSAVRWNVAGDLITAWILTLPAAGSVGFVAYKLLHHIWN